MSFSQCSDTRGGTSINTNIDQLIELNIFMYFIDIALLYKSSDWLYDKNCPYSNTYRYIYIKYSLFFIEFFPPINQEYVLSVNSMGTYSFKQNSK